MIVWAGCVTCRHDPRARKWEGLWVDAEVYPTLTVYDIHQPGYLPDIDDHVMHAFTLTDFGVPPEVEEDTLKGIADFMAMLEDLRMSEPVTLFALFKGIQPWQVDYDEFKSIYAGQWSGKPTRAARKRFVFTPSEGDVYYLWRRTPLPRPIESVRRAVQV